MLQRMQAPAATIALVHADAAWIVIDKPAGLPAVPGRPEHLLDSASARVQALYADALVVHRLDMPTSGLLLFARGVQVQRALGRAFEERRVLKRYVAVVHGELRDDAGSIDLPIVSDWERRPKQRVDVERGRPSLTHWRVLARAPGTTRLELTPVTGRGHQLRVHLAALGHPIVGDALYGPPAEAAARMLLHAAELALAHPFTAEAAHFTSPVPF
jgi:tRNA pseudouridine32 synthase/23S rRNA pseudouridine746 synthase